MLIQETTVNELNTKYDGVALVSGLTPNIFKSVLKDDLNNPETVMRNTLLVERYDFVKEILK